ncbi:MAG: HEAT repeat domain-containing protein [Candidatus Omnitrophica bacterium]|nr:HEAT repeat domain-containing protein [Candidatus Omnitrophota bacterium]
MDESSRKKIVKKVFYTTGTAFAKAQKIQDGLVDITRSFLNGYHSLNGDSLESTDGDHKEEKPPVNPEFEHLKKKAEELLSKFSPAAEIVPPTEKMSQQEQAVVTENKADKAVVNNVSVGDDFEIIHSQDPLIRLKGIVSLGRLNTPQARLAILSMTNDPESSIRRLVANCLNHEGSEAEVFAIVKLINDPDEGVARVAIRKSVKIRNRMAFTYLIFQLKNENAKIRREAIDALNAITGSDLGFDPDASVNSRDKAVERWQELWKDNQMNPQFLRNDEATRLITKKKGVLKQEPPLTPDVSIPDVSPVQETTPPIVKAKAKKEIQADSETVSPAVPALKAKRTKKAGS